MRMTSMAETTGSQLRRRVLHIWYADYPWDVRVQKVILGLRQAGWIVDVLARNKKRLRSIENVDGATVYRLPRPPFLIASIDALLSLPVFVNPRWIYHIWRVTRTTKPDVILVRDLPLAPAALLVGRLRRTPVVLDMAENYPGLLRTLWETGVARPRDLFLRNPWFASLVEGWVLRNSDGIICVIEESASRVRSLGVPERKVTTVRNTPLLDGASQLPSPRKARNADAPLVIAYLGVVERHRGVHELVRAVAECRRRSWPVELLVIGDGIGYSDVRALAIELGVLDQGVRLLGRMENKRALERVASADVGAIPHKPCDAWNTTIPNKLFDYMSLGLPVLTSNVVPVKRIVLEEGCGVCYTSGDVVDLVQAIDMLRSDDVREKMGKSGIEAVQSKYNWSVDARQLDSALRRVAGVRERSAANR